MKRFEGKNVLITGGTKGIGRACAVLFAQEGARLGLTYAQDEQAAEQARQQIEAIPAPVSLCKADMCSTESLTAAWNHFTQDTNAPDVLVLNAAYQRKATVWDTDVELLRKTYEANIVGNFHLAKLFIAGCEREHKPGAIVIHSSNQGELVNPTGFAYALTKAALNHMVRHLAVACARRRIRVNGMVLGWFDTEGERKFYSAEQIRTQAAKGILMGRAGEPEEAARLTLFLASEEASYLTGSLVRDDGGFALAPDLSHLKGMKAVVKHSRDGKPFFRFQSVPAPRLAGHHDVHIGIRAIGICSSDIHALHGAMSVPDGNVVGHEFSGVIRAVGTAVRGLRRGDRVVSELAVGKCGICAMCRSGRYEFCDRKRPPGWASQGAYAESIVVPADLVHKIPNGVSFDVAALAEPTAVCVYGCLERGGIAPEDATVIFGMGSLGLLALIVLKDAGVKHVMCVGPSTKGRQRLDLARELGADAVATPADDLAALLERITGRSKADSVVDCSGAAQAVNQGLRLLRKDGTFIALGIAPRSTIPIAFNTGVLNALRIVFSCTSCHTAWQRTLPLLKRRQAAVDRLITHRLPMSAWKKAFAALEKRQAVKAVLHP